MSVMLVRRAVRVLEALLLSRPAQTANDNGLPRGWIGPYLETWIEIPPESRHLLFSGSHHPHGEAHRVVHVCARVDGRLVARVKLERPGPFAERLPLPAGLLSPLRVTLESEPCFVPDEVLHNGDARRLCFYLDALRPMP